MVKYFSRLLRIRLVVINCRCNCSAFYLQSLLAGIVVYPHSLFDGTVVSPQSLLAGTVFGKPHSSLAGTRVFTVISYLRFLEFSMGGKYCLPAPSLRGTVFYPHYLLVWIVVLHALSIGEKYSQLHLST